MLSGYPISAMKPRVHTILATTTKNGPTTPTNERNNAISITTIKAREMDPSKLPHSMEPLDEETRN